MSHRVLFKLCVFIANVFSLGFSLSLAQESKIGIFEGASDIGDVGKPGEVAFDTDKLVYTVSGGGQNMWFDNDELQFVWKKVDGDISLAATIKWPSQGGDPHRKACLIIRQSLAPGAAYADAVIHGDGLTSIQYREIGGENTHEVQSNWKAPARIRIEKRGDYVAMSVGETSEDMRASGGIFRIHFEGSFYVGLGVCAHNDERLETAEFSDVELKTLASGEPTGRVASTLETISIASTDRRVVYHTTDHIEAPNWSRDGESLIFNSGGSLFRIPVAGGEPVKIDTGDLHRLNNDHGLSPDGKTLVVSDQTKPGGSRIYTLPATGGAPNLVTELAPSYWHGYSPDGKTLAYCAQRNGEYDIYTIPVDGGEETRLTTTEGLDDGPEFSPDGKWIYFNSQRTGTMQIWRMKANGEEQTQLTTDEYNDWFAHPSPDGRQLVFVSFEKEVEGHPANKDVLLRIMPAEGGQVRTLAKLYGGQGTINVPSWSPDGRNVAFVSYQPIFE
jgi:TolB protein